MSEENTRTLQDIIADLWADCLDRAAFEIKAAGWPSNRVLVADQISGTECRIYLCEEAQGRKVYTGDELPGQLIYTQTLVISDVKPDGTPGRHIEIVPRWERPFDARGQALVPGPT